MGAERRDRGGTALARDASAKDDVHVSGVAGRYAQALFDVAKEGNATSRVGADLKIFEGMIEESDDLRRFLRSPAIPADEQVKALDEVCRRAGIAGAAAHFLKLVAAQRRLFAVADMIRAYHALNAEPLKEAHVLALKDALAAVAGSADVNVKITVDPALIGGMVVKLGSRMIDSSLRTKLNTMRTRMKEVG